MVAANPTRYPDIKLADAPARHSTSARDMSPAPPTAPGRLVSLDAYRGLIMILMVSGGLQIGKVVKAFDSTPGWQHLHTPLWDQLAFQTDHVTWTGFSLWDFIQSSFMFMVGTAMAFSLESRRAKGQAFSRMLLHALFRSVALILLAVFLGSNWSNHTSWSFTNVLAQIGLGYPILFLVAWLRPRWQFAVALAILIVYWAAFALYPAPPADLDLASVHLHSNWPRLSGFASHWDKNTNWAAHVDQWFLNLFPRADGKPFTFEDGGYQTLNFIPSIATMIFGLLAGELCRSRLRDINKFTVMLLVGVAGVAAGLALDKFGICPICKRIWTPSWAILSGGVSFLALGFFFAVIDVGRLRRWAYPLVVMGANPIAIYCIWQLLGGWVRGSMQRHFGRDVYELPGRAYGWIRYSLFNVPHPYDTITTYGKLFAPMAEAGFFVLVCWMICWWAYRKRIFIKI